MTTERLPTSYGRNARLWAARVAWIALFALALWLWGVSTVVIIRDPRPPAAQATDPGIFTLEDTEALRQLGLPEVLATVPVAFFLLLDVVYFLLGGWIFWRRSRDWTALLLSFILVGSGAVVFSYAFEVFNRGDSPWLIPINLLTFLVIAAMTLLLFLFPDGKFVPSWTRFLAPVFAGLMASFLLPLPEALGQVAGLVAPLAVITVGIYARVHRFRHYS
ncbi:MAG: hypothetical protein HY531_02520, partial [Chloroflexi bacterium]|nr:hypothetical protein [Chloroflexota bacterium]